MKVTQKGATRETIGRDQSVGHVAAGTGRVSESLASRANSSLYD